MLKWVNLCEANVDILKTYLNAYYARTLNSFQISLPSGVEFDYVTKLYINGIPYKKKDTRAYKEKYSFWYEGGVINFYPACSETDTTYVSDAGDLTFASGSIVTTGDDFTFVTGDSIIVTDCTVNTTNNKSAVIQLAEDDTLTFPSGTFTAGLETGVVTITKASIKLTYLSVPATKLIANILTDTLLIPDRFLDIYDYFCMSKIAYLAKDYADYANHMQSFNAAVARYDEWNEEHRPQRPETDIVAQLDIGYSSDTDFDTEI
jgi:hypothetical protein